MKEAFKKACINLYLELSDKDKDKLTGDEMNFMEELAHQAWFKEQMNQALIDKFPLIKEFVKVICEADRRYESDRLQGDK